MDAYSLGQVLREARESKELEIADVVARLRIRQPILESFEAGDFDIRGVPEIQVRGLLRIYARRLELDEDHILLQYAQMRLAQEKGRRGRRRRRIQTEPLDPAFGANQPLQEYENADRRATGCRGALRLMMLLLVSAAAIAVIIFVTVELVGIEAFLPASATPESASMSPSATAPPPPSDTPGMKSPTPPDGRAQYDGSGILVSILVTQRSWLSISSDGSSVYAGIAEADTLLEQRAESEILLSGANALALDVIWNGQRQGVIGARGQRVDIRFTAEQAVITLGPGGEPTQAPTSEVVAAVSAPVDATPPSAVSIAPSPPALPSAVPTALPTLAPPTASVTPLPTDAPTAAPSPTATEKALPTAILPPRVTQAGLPPTKAGA